MRTRAPHPRGGTSWWKNSASNPGTCLWLLLTYSSLIQNTLNELIPACGHTGSLLPATTGKTTLRLAGIITVSAPSLPYRSCFQREERGLKGLAQHSVVIFDFPPLGCRWGKRKQHETFPFLGLPKTSLCWGKAPCQVPCKKPFVTNLLGPGGT